VKFYISDLHLGHANVLGFDKRPFDTIEEHDLAIVTNINDTLAARDHLYILGDVAWSRESFREFQRRLRTDITVYFIKGNHDHRISGIGNWPDVIWDKEDQIFLSHYPHLSWPKSFHGSIHLYGHVHGNIRGVGRSMDVGANCVGYRPISLDEVREKLEGVGNHGA